MVMSASATELAIAIVAATLATAAAEMARQPRARHFGVLAANEAAGMDYVPHQNGQPHWCRLQDVQEGLVARKGIAMAQTGGELDKTVDDTDGDSQQTSIERPDQPSPARSLVRS